MFESYWPVNMTINNAEMLAIIMFFYVKGKSSWQSCMRLLVFWVIVFYLFDPQRNYFNALNPVKTTRWISQPVEYLWRQTPSKVWKTSRYRDMWQVVELHRRSKLFETICRKLDIKKLDVLGAAWLDAKRAFRTASMLEMCCWIQANANHVRRRLWLVTEDDSHTTILREAGRARRAANRPIRWNGRVERPRR